MTNCNQIKRLIDQADQPEMLPFEATQHLTDCLSCNQFAAERAGLRTLLNGIPRVNAPMNFDAQLKARITTAKAKPAFAWLNPAVYMRFGAASAAILIAVFVAQYNGLFALSSNHANGNQTEETDIAKQPVPPPPAAPQTSGAEGLKIVRPTEMTSSPNFVASTPSINRGSRRVQPVAVRLVDEARAARVPGLLVRGSGGEVEVPMLPVSVGAQQQLINRSGRSTAQPIAISF